MNVPGAIAEIVVEVLGWFGRAGVALVFAITVIALAGGVLGAVGGIAVWTGQKVYEFLLRIKWD